MSKILILGGGAAGIAAAITAAKTLGDGSQITVLEKNPRIGKKLLATGNGRCNLDNTDISIEKYFTCDKQTAEKMLETIDNAALSKWFDSLGLFCRAEETRIYPYSNQAADVLNLFLYWLERLNVNILTEKKAKSISQKGQSFCVSCESGEKFFADAVICAMGGAAAPQFGTDGFGVELARLCGCKTEPLYPCLVPLKCEKSQVSGLSGIRVKANASLFDGENLIHTETGEIQFTENGLSGIAIMQLSGFLSPKRRFKAPVIALDLFPSLTKDELAALILSRSKLFSNASSLDMMTGFLNRRIAQTVLKQLSFEKQNAADIDETKAQQMANKLKNWRFSALEPTGWQNAQTTGGGISLSEIDTKSFSLIGCNGLYFVGETLDCAGFCGGFNLHWAFGSGICAGYNAAQYISRISKRKNKGK